MIALGETSLFYTAGNFNATSFSAKEFLHPESGRLGGAAVLYLALGIGLPIGFDSPSLRYVSCLAGAFDRTSLVQAAISLPAVSAIFLALLPSSCGGPRTPVEGRTRLPAAMAAGVTDTLITFEELFDKVMGNAA